MAHLQSGLWCDLCGKPILSGEWWHIGVNGKAGHCHKDCKESFEKQKAAIDYAKAKAAGARESGEM